MSDRCEAFERWLDVRDGELPPELVAHAETCARCARTRAAMEALERELETAEVDGLDPGAVFVDAVMARIERVEAARTSNTWAAVPAAPWWLDALQHPAMVLAAVAVAILTWKLETLLAMGSTVGVALSRWAGSLGGDVLNAAERLSTGPLVVAGLLLGLTPLLLLGSFVLMRWVARLTDR